MAAVYPGGGVNTYVPSTEASKNMVADFSRNPNSFKISEWTQYVPVDQPLGYWTEMTVEQAGRIINTNLADHQWADGNDAPEHKGEREKFEFKPFSCSRYVYGFRIGEHAAANASWDILAQYARHKAQQAITARTQIATTVATTSGNYPTGHSSAVSSISGVTGPWDQSTVARKDIKRSFDHAFETVHKATLGGVNPNQVMVVVGPETAREMAVSQELVDYIKQSPSAERDLKEGLDSGNPNLAYGLPRTFSGYPLVVEDAVKVTSRKGATKATSYVLPKGTAFMCSRPGELEGVEGAPSFSTFSVFLYEEMLVESKHDRDNKLHRGRVIDYFDVEMTAPISGFLFTSAITGT